MGHIFIDDLGYGDIGPFGATKQRTLNLDRMAREGMKLTSFYAAPVCSVSRAQPLTGCYGARVSVPGVAHSPQLNPQEHLWDELREKEFHNRVFSDMAGVVRTLEAGLPRLAADRERVRSICAWPWIVSLNLNAN